MKRRNRKKYMIILLFLTVNLLLGCERKKVEHPVNSEALETNESQPLDTPNDADAQEMQESNFAEQVYFVFKLVDKLKYGKKISSLMSDEIVFVFHSDDRCEGSTDGIVSNLPSIRIDLPFKMQVTNNGKGWYCEKKKPSTYEMEFDLRDRLNRWRRFEFSVKKQKENSFYIEGAAESDYIVIHIKKEKGKYVVYRLEYRSEDPG